MKIIFFLIIINVLIVNINNGDNMKKNSSIWFEGVSKKNYSKLDKDIDVDVLIIGGGLTGVSTLYYLKDKGLNVVLVEQNELGHGVTGKSTGKLNYLQDSLYDKIKKNCNEEKASEYLKSQIDAINLAVDIVKKNNIDCDLVKVPAFVYTNKEKEIEKLKEYEKFLKDNGIETFVDECKLVESKYLFGVKDTYIFNPYSFVTQLADRCYDDNIYENTSIKDIKNVENGYVCYADGVVINAKWVVIASHYPYFNLPYLFPIKGYLEKSYLSASKYDGDDVSLISYDKPIISMRSYRDYLVYLSNSHAVGSSVDDKKNFEELVKKVNDLKLVPEYLWSNMDIMTNDGLPYIGEIKDKLLIGTGYNTWGLANSVLAGKIISDIVLGNATKYIELFNPNRKNLGMVTGAVVDGVVSIAGYLNGWLKDSSKVSYEDIDGREIAIYKDKDGEHKVYTKCPHMGCRLIFNEVEKTWDCPCHASRFDIDGKCISGPSNEDISYKDEINKE